MYTRLNIKNNKSVIYVLTANITCADIEMFIRLEHCDHPGDIDIAFVDRQLLNSFIDGIQYVVNVIGYNLSINTIRKFNLKTNYRYNESAFTSGARAIHDIIVNDYDYNNIEVISSYQACYGN